MSGVNPHWIAGTDFIMVHRGLVAALDGDYEAAMVLDRIRFRSGRDGWWLCTATEMQDECCLSEWKLRQAIKRLRDAGFVESERADKFRPDLRWRLVLAPVSEESSVTRVMEPSDTGSQPRIPQSPVVEESSVSSTKNSEEGSGAVQEPEQHPSRPIRRGWAPRPAFRDYLRREYPHASYTQTLSTFVLFYLSNQATSKSWEAKLEQWLIKDQAEALDKMTSGTDDLGVPRSQKRTSVVPEALKPGDPGYFNPND